ncbi:MAG: transposase, partial [Dissulfuribacterales bacterium]
HMRIRRSIETVPILSAIGVTESDHRLVLSLQSGDKESASNWREFFKDLKARGLDPQNSSKNSLQRRYNVVQVHAAKNVLVKVPRKLKDDLRSIFYACSKNKAMEFFEQFKKKWKDTMPSAVSCLEKSINACLTFPAFLKMSEYL